MILDAVLQYRGRKCISLAKSFFIDRNDPYPQSPHVFLCDTHKVALRLYHFLGRGSLATEAQEIEYP
jgi:hypothetical protein